MLKVVNEIEEISASDALQITNSNMNIFARIKKQAEMGQCNLIVPSSEYDYDLTSLLMELGYTVSEIGGIEVYIEW